MEGTFAALLNDVQGKGMEGSGGNIPGVQTLLNAFVHLLRRLATKRQQQDLIGDGLARCQQPPRPRYQYGRFAAPGPASTSSDCSPLTTARAQAGFSGDDSTVLKKSA